MRTKTIDHAIEEIMNGINVLDFEEIPGELLTTAPEEITITVAADTGAVANVINPDDLPAGVEPDGVVKHHFIGASNEHIENWGGMRHYL